MTQKKINFDYVFYSVTTPAPETTGVDHSAIDRALMAKAKAGDLASGLALMARAQARIDAPQALLHAIHERSCARVRKIVHCAPPSRVGFGWSCF